LAIRRKNRVFCSENGLNIIGRCGRGEEGEIEEETVDSRKLKKTGREGKVERELRERIEYRNLEFGIENEEFVPVR
jgi:hypothetical protein